MATERITVKPWKGFDPTNREHVDRMLKTVAERSEYGTGWRIQSFNPEDGTLTLTRQSAVTQVTKSAKKKDSYDVGLMAGTKPSDGEQVAAQLESDPRHLGYVMTRFEPFLGQATLSKMTDAERRCRGAVATALSVKPWDVQVTAVKSGGFRIDLPNGYIPSRHDSKLEEVATTVVGRPGWFVRTDAAALVAEFVPSELPTFPPLVSYPLARIQTLSWDRTPFGLRLPAPGSSTAEEAVIDWKASQMGMIAGLPGGGKSVTINAVIAGWLAAGGELVVVDVPDKKSDFLWVKEWVRDGGWGCESDVDALAALSLVYEEGKRRARLNEEHGVTGWRDLPRDVQLPPILVVADEVSGLIVTEKLPAGVPKDNPVVQAKTERNLVRVSIEDVITRIVAEQRAMGIHVILSSQVTNNNTGIGPTTKSKLGQKLLLGANPSKTARAQAFSIEDQVPQVPENVKADGAVAKGVGAAELEGQPPAVFKSYFAQVSDYRAALSRIGMRVTGRPEPTEAEIARFSPLEEGGMVDEPPSRLREEYGGFGRGDQAPRRDDGLTGAAAAAHDLRVAAAQAR